MGRCLRIGLLWVLALHVGAASAGEDEGEEIKATLVAMWAALERGDVERYAEYIHPDYTLFGEGDVYLAKGKAVEVRAMEDWTSRASSVHTQMHQPEVTVRADTAWITYYWTDAGMSGGKRFTTRGKSTRIFVREEGRWLCIHGHFTQVP